MASTDPDTITQLAALSQQMAEAVERVNASIVAIDARPRVRTSGIVWRPGVVVSTNHTIRRDEEITVAFHDGRQSKAQLVGRDPGTDLAVLRVEGEDANAPSTSPQFADASTLRVGNLVLAVGRTDSERGVTASFGVVSTAGGKWRTWRGGEIDRLIRPDLSIFLGFSGGALVNAEGRVVGVNTTGLARGAGVTVPVQTVERVVEQLLTRGRVARPYLGVGMQPIPLPDKLREKNNVSQASALMVVSVEPDAPADKAGITIGDLLLALDDAPIADTDDVQTWLAGGEVGQTIKVKILRGGTTQELSMTLGERPAARQSARCR